MRLREIALVAARELRDALRSRWFVLAAGCFLALSLGLSMLGLAGAQRSGLAGFDRTTASLLNLALLSNCSIKVEPGLPASPAARAMSSSAAGY